METTQNVLSNELIIDARIANHLREASGWARFLGILGFIFAGISAIAAVAVPYYFSHRYSYYDTYGYSSYRSHVMDEQVMIYVIIYIIFAVLAFFGALFTIRFGSKVNRAITMNDQQTLDSSFLNLKFLYRFNGIVAIVFIVLMLLGVIGNMSRY